MARVGYRARVERIYLTIVAISEENGGKGAAVVSKRATVGRGIVFV